MEEIIRRNWVEHLKMITEKYFGFWKERSCVTYLLSYYTQVSEKIKEREGWVDSISLDFKKTFDRVLHQKLLWK